jgi:peptide/nickel transport system substrate-binding protein
MRSPFQPRAARTRGQRGPEAVVSVVVLAVVLASALTACGSGSSSTSSGTGTSLLRLASVETLTTWDPRAAAADEPLYLSNLYEPLLYANPPGSAQPFTPCLATSWEVSKNGLTWTFHLRHGVTFHDGTPFTSAAVKYSYEATKKLGVGSSYIWFPVAKITTPDDFTVNVTTQYPIPLERCASSMYGAWIFSPTTKGKSKSWWDTPHEDGTGPYELASYKPSQQVVFKRNPNYWGGWKPGQYSQVVVQQVSDPSTQRQMLEGGQADIVDGLSFDDLPALQSNPAVKILRLHSVQNAMLLFNTRRKPLDNVKVRQALSYALSYQDILTAGANGYGEISQGPLPRDLYPHDAGLGQYTTNLAKAKQLLAAAGYPNGGFKLLMTYASDGTYGPKFATLVKEDLSKVGVTVTLQPLLFEEQWAKAKGPAGNRQDIFELLWWPGYPDGYDTLYSVFHTGIAGQPVFDLTYWSSKPYDNAVDGAYSFEPTNAAKAQKLYDQAQQMLFQQAPAAYLFDPDRVFGLNPKLKLQTATALNVNYTGVVFWYRVSQ